MGEGGCFDVVCVLGFGVVLVGALCFGLCYGLLYLVGGLLWFGIVVLVFGRVLCVLRDLLVEILGGLRNGVKV